MRELVADTDTYAEYYYGKKFFIQSVFGVESLTIDTKEIVGFNKQAFVTNLDFYNYFFLNGSTTPVRIYKTEYKNMVSYYACKVVGKECVAAVKLLPVELK